MIRWMPSTAICFAAVLSLARPLEAAVPAKDDLVLPKSEGLRFEKAPGERTAPQWPDTFHIGWPAKVLEVNGQWLKIADDGGYTLPSKAPLFRWVRKDEVVKLEQSAVTGYSGKIIAGEGGRAGAKSASEKKRKEDALARLYWLRGIYWEYQKPAGGEEPEIALADFRKATELAPTLADAWIRQGRLLAVIDPVANQDDWTRCFTNAYEQLTRALSRTPAESGACVRCEQPDGRKAVVSKPHDGSPEVLPTPRPEVSLFDWSPLCPPQFYVDVGLAFEQLYARPAPNSGAPNKQHFACAWHYFCLATKSNPVWFRPPRAQAQLLLKRVDHFGGSDWDGEEQKGPPLFADDLFAALALYDKSIGIYDGDAESHGGRAKVLRFLAVADLYSSKNPSSKDPLPFNRFHRLLSTKVELCSTKDELRSTKDEELQKKLEKKLTKLKETLRQLQMPALDASYESANTAALLRRGRSAESLLERARTENEIAYKLPGNVGLLFLTQASATLDDAILLARSTEERVTWTRISGKVAAQQKYGLGDLAAQADNEFEDVVDLANRVKQHLDDGGLDRRTAAQARRTIAEIEMMHTIVKNEGVDPIKPPTDPTKAWPRRLPTLGELVDRDNRIEGWNFLLKSIEREMHSKE